MEVIGGVKQVVEAAEVLITATTAREPIVKTKPGDSLASADKDKFLVCSFPSGRECRNDSVRILMQREKSHPACHLR